MLVKSEGSESCKFHQNLLIFFSIKISHNFRDLDGKDTLVLQFHFLENILNNICRYFAEICRRFAKQIGEKSRTLHFLQTVLALVAGRTDRRHVVARDDDGRAEPRKARRYVFAGSLVAGLAKLAK